MVTTSEQSVVCCPSTPHRILLAELDLLPLQVLWWQQTLQFWNNLAALPLGSFYRTVCLDNLNDAFQGCLQYGQLCGGLLGFSVFSRNLGTWVFTTNAYQMGVAQTTC